MIYPPNITIRQEKPGTVEVISEDCNGNKIIEEVKTQGDYINNHPKKDYIPIEFETSKL